MKKLLLFALIIFSAMACSPDEKVTELDEQSSNLTGVWQLVEQCECIFMTSKTFQPVPEHLKFFFKFQKDGTVETNRHQENCNEGTYEIKTDAINFDFQCLKYELNISSVNESELILEGTVDEGVMKYKFEKINK